MDMTGWLQGQVFVQTVDEQEVEAVTAFLNARGLGFQVLTLSERMVVEGAPEGVGDDGLAAVSSDRFSIAIQVGGFPQVVGPVLQDLIGRVHGGTWDPEDPGENGLQAT